MSRKSTGKLRRFIGGAFSASVTLLALAVIFAANALTPAAAADADPSKPTLSLSQYEAELDRLAEVVSDLPQHPDQIEVVRKSLPASWQVQAGTDKYEVSAAWLSTALIDIEKKPSARKDLCVEAVEQLRSLRAEAERIGGSAAGAHPADARARLNKILSQREYQQVHESSWGSKIWEQVERWIDWLLEHTLGRVLEEGVLRTTILYAILIVVFLCVALWIVRSLRSIVRKENYRVDAVFPPGKHWRDFAKEALSAAGHGDYRAAVHAAYWAGVYRLAELGAWRLDRARTPREYLRMIREPETSSDESAGRPQLLEPSGAGAEINLAGRVAALAALTRSMEASWYGFLPATEKDFDNAVNELETLGCRLRSTVQTAKS
jgi:hypothetical protein